MRPRLTLVIVGLGPGVYKSVGSGRRNGAVEGCTIDRKKVWVNNGSRWLRNGRMFDGIKK